MRLSLNITLLLSAFFACYKIAPLDSNGSPTDYIEMAMSEPDTGSLGFNILQMEKNAGFSVALSAIERLRKIRCDASISLPRINTRAARVSKKQILASTGTLLRANSLLVSEYHSKLSTCLQYQIVDCDILSLLYLDISEQEHWPLALVLLPQHTIIRWADEKDTIYWETITNKETNLAALASTYSLSVRDSLIKIPKWEQLKFIALYNIAKDLADVRDYLPSLNFCNYIIRQWPQWEPPYRLAGKSALELDQCEEALNYYEIYLKKFPTHRQARREYEQIRLLHLGFQGDDICH